MREIPRKLHKQCSLVKIESRKMLLIARIHIILRKLTAARNYFLRNFLRSCYTLSLLYLYVPSMYKISAQKIMKPKSQWKLKSHENKLNNLPENSHNFPMFENKMLRKWMPSYPFQPNSAPHFSPFYQTILSYIWSDLLSLESFVFHCWKYISLQIFV